MEMGWQYRCTPVFLKTRAQSFQKVWKWAGSSDERPYVSKHGHRVSRKYGNRDVNECEFVVREADRKALTGSYRSLTFAYFKPFPGLKFTASDWSKKFVKPMNIDFAAS